MGERGREGEKERRKGGKVGRKIWTQNITEVD